MARVRFNVNPESPYHVAARSNGRDWFAIPIEEVWAISSRYLFFLHHAFGVRIHSFVLMNNHWHLIAEFPEANFSEAMTYFMRETSRCIGRAGNRINHVYGGRCFRSEIQTARYFSHAYKYVYRNPVEAGVSRLAENYDFSTLRSLIGCSHTIIPLVEDKLLFQNSVSQVLDWINRKPQDEDRDSVRSALRKSTFSLRNDRSTRDVNRLETSWY